MGKWLAVAALGALATGCNYGTAAYHCTSDEQCQGGRCELAEGGMCSHPDPSCPSGRRFGDVAGAQSNDCVGGEGIDAGPDSPDGSTTDASACFGTGLVRICLQAAPSQAAALDGAINTDSSSLCQPIVSGGNVCVVAATTLTIAQPLRATGTRPLVLIGSDTIMATAAIDVGSHRGSNPETGAGADPATCGPGLPPGASGGGAGGSFNGLGGSGANGGGTAAQSLDPVPALRGGCAGQDGATGTKGVKGHGGGAVFLIAGTKIVATGGINAGGEGGGGGQSGNAGGGGGGSGGMIGFDAPALTLGGRIIANGGGGGEGSSNGTAGSNGADAVDTAAALGGSDGPSSGGNGGPGSSGSRAGPGFGGLPGSNSGGGGGGGAGLVIAPGGTSSGGVMLSPPFTDA